MTKSAMPGPLIVYGDRNALGTGATGSNNADKAPSLIWGGAGIIDPRVGYNQTRYGAIGFAGAGDITVIDAVPSTLSTTNIAASQAVAGGAAFVLVSSTGAGVTVLSAATTVWASGNTIAANSLALDGAPGLVGYGLANLATGFTTVSVYDPTKTLTRNVRVTSGGGGDSGTVTVVGADLYGYTQSEAITVSAAGTASGKKAFKFITSATLSGGGTLSAGSSLGTGDVYGFPLLANTQGYVSIFWNNAWVTANTGFLGADTTSPATTTTGDVRGTYALQAASNNTLRLYMSISLAPANLGTNTGLFGVTPV